MKIRAYLLVCLLTLAVGMPAYGEQPLADPIQEKRAQQLFTQLRCMVCEGQNIADSNAPLAADMRHAIRKKIKEGMSEEAVTDFLVTRYGESILMRPRLHSATYLLWFGPLLFLLAGAAIIFRYAKSR
jgi:cytochrome c-type biogenesis protein CcmH